MWRKLCLIRLLPLRVESVREVIACAHMSVDLWLMRKLQWCPRRRSLRRAPSGRHTHMVAIAIALATSLGWTTLDSATFDARIASNFFGVIIDTRQQSEWDAGHIPNATLIANLQITGDASALAGCQSCNIGVYCRSGARSQGAATALENAGFTNVYDVQGINQWQAAGHSLVTTPSHTPACTSSTSQCSLYAPPSPPPRPATWPALPPSPLLPPPPLPPSSDSTYTIALAVTIPFGVLLVVATLVFAMRVVVVARRRRDAPVKRGETTLTELGSAPSP